MSEGQAAGGFGWDDAIDPKAAERVLLPKGPARFVVQAFKRDRREFGKFGVCNIAALSVLVRSEETKEEAELDVNLPLVKPMLWKLLAFFTAIGQREHGDEGEFAPNWAEVEGAIGGCIVDHREVKRKKDGSTYEVNDISEFIPVTDERMKPAAAAKAGAKATSRGKVPF